MALQTSNADVLVAASAPFLRSPSPSPEPAKLSPSLKQPQQPTQALQQLKSAQVRRASPVKKPVSSKAPVAGSKRSVTDSLVVEDDSKPFYRDIGSVADGIPWETVVLRPPFSLF